MRSLYFAFAAGVLSLGVAGCSFFGPGKADIEAVVGFKVDSVSCVSAGNQPGYNCTIIADDGIGHGNKMTITRRFIKVDGKWHYG